MRKKRKKVISAKAVGGFRQAMRRYIQAEILSAECDIINRKADLESLRSQLTKL